MKFWEYAIILLTVFSTLNFEETSCRRIQCEVVAKELNANLKAKLNGSVFWTTMYSGAPPFFSYPSFRRLGRTYLVFRDEGDSQIMVSETIIAADEPHSDIIYYKHEFQVDDKFAIFDANMYFERVFIRNEALAYVHGDSVSVGMPAFKFALVYAEENNNFLIYQSCDKRYAWAQIEDKIMMFCIEKNVKYDRAFNLEIIDVLISMNIDSNVIKTELKDLATIVDFLHVLG